MSNPTNRAGILGTGRYVPAREVPNEWFTGFLDTSDEWITERTGIKSRHFAADDEFTSDMAANALKNAVANAGLELSDIDYILLGTATPDTRFPNTANWVTHHLGIEGIPSLDISTACSGFVYSLELASALVNAGNYKRVACIGAEKLSAICNFEDRSTCVLFGDGAGCAIVGAGGHEIVATKCYSHFNYDALHLKSSGVRFPITEEAIRNKDHLIRMNGREVYRFVVSVCVDMLQKALSDAGLKGEDIALFVPHQANSNMLEFAADKAGIPKERMYINIDRFGNTSGASIPIALHEAVEAGRIKKGDYVLLMGFGGGLSSGYSILRW